MESCRTGSTFMGTAIELTMRLQLTLSPSVCASSSVCLPSCSLSVCAIVMTLRSGIELTACLIFRLRPRVCFSLFNTICRLMPGTHARYMPGFYPPISLHWQSSSCLFLVLTYTLSVAIGAAVYSCSKKLMTDKTLRLYRNSPESREH